MFSFQPGSIGQREPDRRGRGPEPRPDFTDAGLTLFLCSLGIVFVSAILGYLQVRASQEAWASPWSREGVIYACTATLALLFVHGCYQSALCREWTRDARRWLAYALFGLMFYGWMQTLLWVEADRLMGEERRMEYAILILLTGLHGLHVLGALVATSWRWHHMGSMPKATETRPLMRLRRYSGFLLLMWGLVMLSLIV